MDRCDALVVGGGPAGSTCAGALAAAGLDVVVLDRRTFPRPKVCAGWVTPQVFLALGVTPEQYGAARVCQPLRGFRLSLLGGPAVEIDYGRPVSYGILRPEFDHFLLQRAGARLRLGEPLKALERTGDGWLANGWLEAPVVVGAGGHGCPVARSLGLGGEGPLVAALEVEYRMSGEEARRCRVAPEVPGLAFLPTLDGYGWCFRKADILNVGLGREAARGVAAEFRRYAGLLEAQGLIPKPPLRLARGHAYRLWSGTPGPLAADGALVIGDAAGLAYPRSGEGIRPAIESARLAAKAILAARGDYRRASLEPYERDLGARLGGDKGSPALPAGLRHLAARALLGAPGLARRVLLDRWFLRRGEAAIA